MKKTITVLLLVLGIVTSMVAGTMAIYTKTLAPIDGKVTAKKFYINAGVTSQQSLDLKLAPTEKETTSLEIANFKDNNFVSEVPVDVNIKIDLGSHVFDGLEIRLYDNDNNLLVTSTDGKGLTYDSAGSSANFTANNAETKTYKVEFYWNSPNGSDVDTEDGMNETNTAFSITVTGTQRV